MEDDFQARLDLTREDGQDRLVMSAMHTERGEGTQFAIPRLSLVKLASDPRQWVPLKIPPLPPFTSSYILVQHQWGRTLAFNKFSDHTPFLTFYLVCDQAQVPRLALMSHLVRPQLLSAVDFLLALSACTLLLLTSPATSPDCVWTLSPPHYCSQSSPILEPLLCPPYLLTSSTLTF